MLEKCGNFVVGVHFDSIFSPKRTIILSSINLAATCTIMHVMCNNIIPNIIWLKGAGWYEADLDGDKCRLTT